MPDLDATNSPESQVATDRRARFTVVNGAATASGASTNSVDTLAELARSLSAKHAAALAAFGAGLDVAMDAGDDVITVFERVGHGRRERWLKEQCGISLRTANNYRALAQARAIIGAKRHGRADFGIRAALRLIGRSPDGSKKARAVPALTSASWRAASPEEQRTFVRAVGVEELLSALPAEPGEEAAPLSQTHLSSVCKSLKLALGTTNDGERLAALNAVNRILASVGRDYHNLIAALERKTKSARR